MEEELMGSMSNEETDIQSEEPKKRRGRPKKEEQPVSEAAEQVAEEDESEAEAESKEETDETEAPKKRRGRPKKVLTPEEEIQRKTQRSSLNIITASREERREIYDTTYIIDENGEYIPNEELSRKDEEWKTFASAAANGKILSGVISTWKEIDHDENDEDHIPQYMARISHGPGGKGLTQVLIPSYVLFDHNLSLLSTKEGAEKIRKEIDKRIGSEINYVVRNANEKTGIVIGDRLGAMSLKGIGFYTSKTDEPPRIKVGDIVRARIVANDRDYITVECCGAEFNIPVDELSYFYISDVRFCDGERMANNFTIGAKVQVKITSVKIVKKEISDRIKYSLVKATGSVKQAYTNPKKKYFDSYDVGVRRKGIITGITPRHVYVNIDNQIEVQCKHPLGRSAILGDARKVLITDKDPETFNIYGKISES